VAIRKGGGDGDGEEDGPEVVINVVRPDYVIEEGDRLVVVGSDADLEVLSDLK